MRGGREEGEGLAAGAGPGAKETTRLLHEEQQSKFAID